MYLSQKDYHRFHTPMSGTLKEARVITERCVSSVNLTAEKGVYLRKGDEFRYFIIFTGGNLR